MTREEKIELLEKEKAYMLAHGGDRQAEALTSAIQALEAIEKIKTEIKNYLEDEKYPDDGITDVGTGLELALNIINRVIKEYME